MQLKVWSQKKHPFLIASEKNFEEIQKKKTISPFKEMIVYASENIDVKFKPEEDPFGPCATLMARLSLLYLTTDKVTEKKEYKKLIIDGIDNWEEFLPKVGFGHKSVVWASGALLNTIVALDVVYNDLSKEEIADAEAKLLPVIEWYKRGKKRDGKFFAWRLARYGVIATWYAYKDDIENLTIWAEKYKSKLLDQSLTSDGSWVHSPGYAFARIINTRNGKSSPIDILQHIGYYDFYEDSKMKGFVNWVNHFAVTPFGYIPKFGENGSFTNYMERSVLHFHAQKYGKELAENSMYLLEDRLHPKFSNNNILFSYILMPLKRSGSKPITSIAMPNTGVSLWGGEGGKEALQGILYSQKRENWELGGFHHIAEDVNSLGIHGYGAYLLANVGTSYNTGYPGTNPRGGRWTEAWMQNVVTLNNKERHQRKGHGGGLIESMTGDMIEYGITHSAGTLDHALHKRGLFMIHEDEDVKTAYFLVLDNVNFEYHKYDVKVNWQPNTAKGSTKKLNETTFFCPANGNFTTESTDGSEGLQLVFVSPSDSLQIKESYKATFRDVVATDNIQASYTPKRKYEQAKALTILYPTDKNHKVPEISQLHQSTMSVANIKHSNKVRDIILEPEIDTTNTFENITFNGSLLFYRRSIDKKPIINAYKAKHLIIEDKGAEYGFKAQKAISYLLENNKIKLNLLYSTPVRFYYPNAKKIRVNGKKPNVLEKSSNEVEIKLEEGQHTISFE